MHQYVHGIPSSNLEKLESKLPEIFPSTLQIFLCPLAFIFSLFFQFFSFLLHLLTNQLKFKKKTHTLGLIVSPPINTPMSRKMAYLAHELYY